MMSEEKENENENTLCGGQKRSRRTGVCRRLCLLLTAALTACLLGACGPEPGKEETGGGFFGEENSGSQGAPEEQDPVGGAGTPAAQENAAAPGTGDGFSAAMQESAAAEESAAAGTSAQMQAAQGVSGIPGGMGGMPDGETAVDPQTLEELQSWLNEDSSYGFLCSVYETPEEIDLNQVFYSGAGYPQKELEDREKELLLDRIPQKKLDVPVVKVTQEQIGQLLEEKAGISYENSAHPLEKEDGWAHIGRYDAWYALRGDTNRMYIACTDAWQQGDVFIVHYRLSPRKPGEAGEKDAVYQPVYEAQLTRKGEGWLFRSNIFWMQKDLIEAQSYRADLNPVGEVFFAPFYPDREVDDLADVTFALVKGKELYALLAPVEPGNIRSDRRFEGVDAVDFTDYNGDGYADILTVCRYTAVDADGHKGKQLREARVYTGQKDGVPVLDQDKTEAVNRTVETLNITNVTEYLTGKSDGKAKKYSSWKEAFADHIRGLDTSEYKGFSLIYINDDRTPELVQTGATTAKGATIVVYRNGTLEETWLNRNTFQYLEYENLLYSASGVENLHYDSIYSIVAGHLGVSVQGYYGNSRFARAQFDENGKETCDYYWDDGEVSASGYRDGISFVFDASRAKECGSGDLLSAEELLKELDAE